MNRRPCLVAELRMRFWVACELPVAALHRAISARVARAMFDYSAARMADAKRRGLGPK